MSTIDFKNKHKCQTWVLFSFITERNTKCYGQHAYLYVYKICNFFWYLFMKSFGIQTAVTCRFLEQNSQSCGKSKTTYMLRPIYLD